MDKKLNKLDSLEEKVSKFDSELKKLWIFVNEEFKENKDAMSKVTERIDGLEFSLGLAQEQITQMTNDKAKVNDTLLYVQSQSMRNNLIFTGITEDVNEKPDVTESKLRTFMVEKLKSALLIVSSSNVHIGWEITLVLAERVGQEALLLNFCASKIVKL